MLNHSGRYCSDTSALKLPNEARVHRGMWCMWCPGTSPLQPPQLFSISVCNLPSLCMLICHLPHETHWHARAPRGHGGGGLIRRISLVFTRGQFVDSVDMESKFTFHHKNISSRCETVCFCCPLGFFGSKTQWNCSLWGWWGWWRSSLTLQILRYPETSKHNWIIGKKM